MNKRYRPQRMLPIVALLIFLTGCEQQAPALQLAEDTAKQLPAFSFSDLEGNQRASREWDNKILVINYWATWCAPCRREMPLFIETQNKLADKGVQFVGIAIDEPNLIQDFADVYDINFPTLLGDTKAMELSSVMGNRFQSLPFTAIYDRQGKTQFVHAGEVTEEMLNKVLIPLL